MIHVLIETWHSEIRRNYLLSPPFPPRGIARKIESIWKEIINAKAAVSFNIKFNFNILLVVKGDSSLNIDNFFQINSIFLAIYEIK
jgi:hypothetical protein